MRAVVQRVDRASVTVDEKITGEVQKGLLVLLGVAEGDTDKDLAYIIDKVCGMRIFEDEAGKMNLSVKDVGGAILAVSQFTLCGDCRHGKRPSFTAAAAPDVANAYYERFVDGLPQGRVAGRNRHLSRAYAGRAGEQRSGNYFAGQHEAVIIILCIDLSTEVEE